MTNKFIVSAVVLGMCVIGSVWTVARGDDGGGNHFQLRLEGFEDVAVVRLADKDVVRHPLVGRMLSVL